MHGIHTDANTNMMNCTNERTYDRMVGTLRIYNRDNNNNECFSNKLENIVVFVMVLNRVQNKEIIHARNEEF